MTTIKRRVAKLEAQRAPAVAETITEIHLMPLMLKGKEYTGPPLAVLHIGPRSDERQEGEQ